MLTKREQGWLEKLIAKDGVKGKYQLKRALWLNTVKPKFKIGSKVTVTNRNHYICGKQVVDWDGVVTGMKFVYDNPDGRQVIYEIELKCIVNGSEKLFKEYSAECDTKARRRTAAIKEFRVEENGHYEYIDAGIYL